jgi:surface protein
MKKIILLLLIAPVLGFGQYVFNTKADLQTAVNFYIDNKSTAISQYGDINTWDVSNITDMYQLFEDANTFNDDISSWNTSNVTSMNRTFLDATSFNQDISSWCVTNISSEPQLFSFNCPLIESNKPIWGTCPTASVDDQNQLGISIYPNPTTSILTIEGNKEYDIEVYDMAGNKVMALTGNTIDMSHLSSATYIVKALDKAENEEVSYKVVKN